MISGSYEVAWRFDEADPAHAYDLYRQAVALEGPAINVDLEHMGNFPAELGDAGIWLGNYYGTGDELPPNVTPNKPVADLGPKVSHETKYTNLHDERVLCVGAGAGAVIMGGYLVRRGVPAENVTFIDPSGRFGGIWQHEWAQTAGFNNPGALSFDRRSSLSLRSRDGMKMAHYLNDIAGDHFKGSHMYPETVEDLRRERQGGDKLWVATDSLGNRHEADTVIVATGRPEPRKIDGKYVRSNLDTIGDEVDESELKIERYQRRLTDEELGSGRPIILVGLGNSTAAMLNQIQDYQARSGETVQYAVVTHRSWEAVEDPENGYDNHQPIFRDPSKGYLTGYSGDLSCDRDAYDEAFYANAFYPGTHHVHYDKGSRQLAVATSDGTYMFDRPHVFALVGYERDNHIFQKMGALSRGFLGDIYPGPKDQPDIRPSDGAIATRRDGYNSNAYAIGAAAADKNNPNAAVLPGIQAQAPATTLTIATRNIARKPLVGL